MKKRTKEEYAEFEGAVDRYMTKHPKWTANGCALALGTTSGSVCTSRPYKKHRAKRNDDIATAIRILREKHRDAKITHEMVANLAEVWPPAVRSSHPWQAFVRARGAEVLEEKSELVRAKRGGRIGGKRPTGELSRPATGPGLTSRVTEMEREVAEQAVKIEALAALVQTLRDEVDVLKA